MRRKAEAKKAPLRAAQGNANKDNNNNIKAREITHLKTVKLFGRPTKTPTGKGLGKAGAKRLGRLLKRAVQDQQESTGKREPSLPKTPVRLFKHQIQTGAENAPKTNIAKPASHQVSQLILSVVSQCKHRGGLSMAELKKTLAAEGYNVSNSRQVNVVTKRLVNNEALVRTTRSVSFRLNRKKPADRINAPKSPELKADLKRSNTASKSLKGRETAQRQVRRTAKTKGKSQKTKAKTHGATARSHKPTGKTRTVAAKSQKPTGRTHKAAVKSQKPARKTHRVAAKSQKPRRKTLKAQRKSPKLPGKKGRSTANKTTRVRRSPRKTQRSPRRRPKQNRYSYKSSPRQQPTRRRSPRTRSRFQTRQRRGARRGAYYYY